jgi:hypothetical protein
MAFAVGPAKSTCEYILATALVAVCLVKAAGELTCCHDGLAQLASLYEDALKTRPVQR